MSKSNRKLLGAWLRACRNERGMSARAVAALLGIHVTAVYNVERAVHVPRFDLLDRWLALFDVNLLVALGVVQPDCEDK